MLKWTRLWVVLIVLALLAGLTSLTAGWKLIPAEAAPADVDIGSAGRNAIEFIGRINQEGPDFTGFGYLTYIRDLDDEHLFTNAGPPSEETARFTFYATATMSSRAVLSDVFVINSLGTMTFYFDSDPSGRDFDDPDSFTSGTAIATASMRYQDILLVQGPNKGLATGVAEVDQLTATAFTLDGDSYTLGQPGLFYRFSSVGNGTRIDDPPNPNFPRSFVLFAGNAVTTGQQVLLPILTRETR
jgi:hypothetical protein